MACLFVCYNGRAMVLKTGTQTRGVTAGRARSRLGRLVVAFGRVVRLLVGGGVVGMAVWLGFTAWVYGSTASRIYAPDAAAIPAHHVGLVFGAGLDSQGGPSAVLYDRVATGVALYQAGKVDKLLMSGDNSSPSYSEVAAMRRTAVDLGVPASDIVLDYAGFSTFDSCYRARDVFGLRAVTLVTNGYHLPRALYVCSGLGVEAVGVAADRRTYAAIRFWTMREWVALPAAWIDLHLGGRPTFLGPAVDVDNPPEQP